MIVFFEVIRRLVVFLKMELAESMDFIDNSIDVFHPQIAEAFTGFSLDHVAF